MSLRDALPIMFLLDEMKDRNCQVMCTTPHVYCKVFEDNSGALELARLPKLCPRTKHINVCYHHFREHARSRKVKIFPWNQGSDCWHLKTGSSSEFFLLAWSSYLWIVTQDALVRECAIYYTTALMLLISRIAFSVWIVRPRFRGILLSTFTWWIFTWLNFDVPSLLAHRTWCTQNLMCWTCKPTVLNYFHDKLSCHLSTYLSVLPAQRTWRYSGF